MHLDRWVGGILDACRSGARVEDDYNFPHGYPAKELVLLWHRRRDDASFARDASGCVHKPCHIREHWGACPSDHKYECC